MFYLRLACRLEACNGYVLYLSNLIGICDVIDVYDLIDFWMSIFIRERKRLTFSHFLSFLCTEEKKKKMRKRNKKTMRERERAREIERKKREKQRLLLTEREREN